MKILYVGGERGDAQAAAAALRALAQNLSVSWTSRLDYAARWIRQNEDLAALVVDARVDRTGWREVLGLLRALASRPRIVVLTPEHAGPQHEFMEADEFLTKNDSWTRDLSVVVKRALDRTGPDLSAPTATETAAVERARDLERRLADTQAALERAEKRHQAELTAAAQQATQQKAQYDIGLARAAATWEMVDEQLREAAVNVARSRRDQEAAAANADRLSRREAELSSQLAEVTATRITLEQRLADTETALADVTARAAQAASEYEAAAKLHRDEIADATARLRELEAALHAARQDNEARAADVARLVAREAELTSMLATVTASHTDLERRLAATEAAFQDVSERATRERLASAKRAAEREAELDAQIQRERTVREQLELANAEAAAALQEAERRHEAASTAAAQERAAREAHHHRRLAEAAAAALEVELSLNQTIEAARVHALEQAAQFEARLADVRRQHEIQVAELRQCIHDRTGERDAVQQSLSATEEQLRCLGAEHREALQRYDEGRRAADAEIERLTLVCGDIERAFEAARAESRETVDRLSREHAAALAAKDQDIEQRKREIVSLNQTLQNLQARLQDVQREADRVPPLLRQLDENRAESERLFQQAPVAMFRCGRDGSLKHANRAWSTLVRRKPDELRAEDFAAVVFESPKDLSWLIERCLSTRSKESIETTLRRDDGARLFVRLSACASFSNDVIEIVAEDLTRPRILQDRLAQAGRMEAVGRLASEVAITCGKLLGDARQHAEQWLTDAGPTGIARQHGEMVVDDLTRAAGYLEQLVAYGGEQTRPPTPVDLHTVVRHLAPVLKHVAGDNVEVRLADTSPAVTVDVEPERVERLLVNLAAYGRERMPFGCELSIEIGTSIVGQHFAAKYPSVRPGPHALITVTEARRAPGGDALLEWRGGSKSADDSRAVVNRKPAVDLGTLQTLVGECGGHLWMKVQPLGDIVAKIRLPLLTSYGQTHARSVAARGQRPRTIARWFQH